MKTSAVILAAGSSSRLGIPKQLLEAGGRSLLRRAALEACSSRAAEVIAVLGSDAARMRKETEGLPVRTLVNNDWREGIASSVRRAVRTLGPDIDAALFMVCDQVRLSSRHLDALMDAAERSPGHPVASGYGGTAGVPALFPRALFGELLRVTGDRGAQRVLGAHEETLITIDWPEGAIDLDIAGDLTRGI